MTITTTDFIAIIPTHASGLYDTFGLDIVIPAEFDEDGICIRDFEPIEWIEAGDFPEDTHTAEVRDMLETLASERGYGLAWGTRRAGQSEFDEVEARKVTR